MTIEFMHPLRLIALPVCSAVILGLCLLRRSRSRKERISHILRHVIILLTVLAMAGMSLLSASSDRTAFLLVDVSDSVNEEETLRLAREALENTGNRKTGVIAFGRNAAVERSLNQTSPLTELTARVDRSGSDLNSALQMASALLPTDSNGGIAVISDGRVTGEENFFSSAGGVPVNVLRTESRSGADAQVTSVSVPSSLYTGQKYTTMVTVHASEAGEAVLMLSRDRWFEAPLYRENPDLEKMWYKVCDGLDGILERYGYTRLGDYYDYRNPDGPERPAGLEDIQLHGTKEYEVRDRDDEKTLVFFCHLGVTCVMLAHLLNVSPVLLWHGTFLPPAGLVVMNAEKRLHNAAFFRMQAFGDTAHLLQSGVKLSGYGAFSTVFRD